MNHITLGFSDLVVTAANVPTTAIVGETISVSWTVTNQSSVSAIPEWNDYVFISDDEIFDDVGDIFLTNVETGLNEPLVPLKSYTTTQNITLDSTTPGLRYLLFVTLDEDENNNNVLVQPITLNAPDLVVTAANVPTTATVGETISVSWTVTNQSNVSAFADYWFDYIYISDDEFFDDSDTSLSSRFEKEIQPLAAGDSYIATQDVDLGSYVETGDRYLLFIADGYKYQGETNEINNVKAVPISIYSQDQILKGTSRRNILTGSDTNNLITGFKGADILTGGAGNDRFVYTSMRDAGDIITDFEVGKDKIVLTQLLDSLVTGGYNGTNAIADGYVKVVLGNSPNNFRIQIDTNGLAPGGIFKPFIAVNLTNLDTLNSSNNFVF